MSSYSSFYSSSSYSPFLTSPPSPSPLFRYPSLLFVIIYHCESPLLSSISLHHSYAYDSPFFPISPQRQTLFFPQTFSFLSCIYLILYPIYSSVYPLSFLPPINHPHPFLNQSTNYPFPSFPFFLQVSILPHSSPNQSLLYLCTPLPSPHLPLSRQDSTTLFGFITFLQFLRFNYSQPPRPSIIPDLLPPLRSLSFLSSVTKNINLIPVHSFPASNFGIRL